jgi:hypothetical protein
VKLWDVASGHELLTIPRPGRDLAFGADDVRLAVAGPDGTAWVWEARPRPDLVTRRGAGAAVSLSPDGRLLAVAGDSDTVAVWEARTDRLLYRLPGRSERNPRGHTQAVRRAVFGPGGRNQPAAGADQTVKLWDADARTVLKTFTGHTNVIRDVAFRPDGAQFASAGADEVVRVWDVSSGKEVTTFHGHADRVSCVAYSPDGALSASGDDDKAVVLWEVRGGEARADGVPEARGPGRGADVSPGAGAHSCSCPAGMAAQAQFAGGRLSNGLAALRALGPRDGARGAVGGSVKVGVPQGKFRRVRGEEHEADQQEPDGEPARHAPQQGAQHEVERQHGGAIAGGARHAHLVAFRDVRDQ